MAISQYFVTGFVVPELEPAIADFTARLGVEFTPIQEADISFDFGDHIEHVTPLRFVYSLGSAPHIELLESKPDGYYKLQDGGGYIRHIGAWADDLAAESAKLTAAGMPLEAAGIVDGVSPAGYVFHTDAHGLRIELVDSANREGFEAWLAGGEYDL